MSGAPGSSTQYSMQRQSAAMENSMPYLVLKDEVEYWRAGVPQSSAPTSSGLAGGDVKKEEPTRIRNPLTYPKSDDPFSYKLFRGPTAEYRGCPLWAWNTKLDMETMVRQIGYLQEMGFGGFHMHPRVGLDTEYLGDEFMDIVKTCVQVAEKKGMMACLYDEDRWPSGVAGGKVIEKNLNFKAQHLLFTVNPYGKGGVGGCSPSSAAACRSENGVLLARYVILLDTQDGTLLSSRWLHPIPSLDERLAPGETMWYAYAETNPPSAWFNGQTYVDTLSHAAIKEFIDTTHERYKSRVGDKFGSTIPCIFTDEPQFATKTRLPNPWSKQDMFLPWTPNLPITFDRKYYGIEDYSRRDVRHLIQSLPELFWNLPDNEPSTVRYRFHDHVCERFVSAFMDQLGTWCTSNNLLLNGHMMEEPTLESQTHSLGEAMRCYRSQTLPGIDLLSDMVEYNTAKQASSVARQTGRKGCMSELYGCTHWTFTFEGHKGQGDWQAALGVTFRVPHLAWMSMAGEAKRDYPASINYQSPWAREYSYVEDHFARVAVAMTRGRAVTRVAVIHPIESFWLAFGPGIAHPNDEDQTQKRDQRFKELTQWLLHGSHDFDFISESLLPTQSPGVQNKKLIVGQCAYEAIIVPDLLTIRKSTLNWVNIFIREGGKVIVAGSMPKYVNAEAKLEETPWPLLVNPAVVRVPWTRDDILLSLEEFRELEIVQKGSTVYDHDTPLLYQMREDGGERFVFICNTDRTNSVKTNIHIRGQWEVEFLDTLNGTTGWLETNHDASTATKERAVIFESTMIPYEFEGCASVLLRLVRKHPFSRKRGVATWLQQMPRPLTRPELTYKQVDVTLQNVGLTEHMSKHSGRNVLMLDYAQYCFAGDAGWSHVQEILALNNEMLARLGLPQKGMAWRQPWTLPTADREPRIDARLVFGFMSDFDVPTATHLAVEMPEGTTICMNGKEIFANGTACFLKDQPEQPSTANGDWFVDEAIGTIPIPGNNIVRGCNYINFTFPFGMLTPIERIYILGNFRAQRRVGADRTVLARAKITPWEDLINWGDITTQGLPFYAGNVTYKCDFTLPTRSHALLSVPKFSSPVLAVEWGDQSARRKGRIAFQPRRLDLGILGKGTHTVCITAYGNRYNAFGHIHTPDWMTNCWPDAWRSQGWAWTDDYNVKPIGILECPTVLFKGVAPVPVETGTPECSTESTPKSTPPLSWTLLSRPTESGPSSGLTSSSWQQIPSTDVVPHLPNRGASESTPESTAKSTPHEGRTPSFAVPCLSGTSGPSVAGSASSSHPTLGSRTATSSTSMLRHEERPSSRDAMFNLDAQLDDLPDSFGRLGVS